MLSQSRPSKRSRKGERKASANVPLVVEHLAPTDLSQVAKESDYLKKAVVCFVNYGQHSKAALEGLVKRLGGQVRTSMHHPGT